MRVVLLDRKTLGSDIDVEAMFSEYEFVSYDLTSKMEIGDRIKDAEVIITNKVIIGKEEMEKGKKLKLICLAATGYNNIDTAAAKEKGIVVANVKDYSTGAVAQTVFAYISEFATSLIDYNNAVKKGRWSKSPIFTLLDFPVYELEGSTLGIIGYGKIGERVANIAKAYGMNVMVAQSLSGKSIEGRVQLESIYRECDFITIHVPLNEKTRNLITYKEFGLMKSNAVIINTARGGIINEEDLYKALKEKVIRGAALDVMTQEPPNEDNKLLTLDNLIITPHTAWAAEESRIRLINGIKRNIELFKSGEKKIIDVCQ